MIFREIAHRRVRDKQQVRLIENPSFGVSLANDRLRDDDEENTDSTHELSS